eukprot:TRINITY_DN15045_c0_g1_i2.p1 TRINITY_DN15045_c0_g1~~TRINITY_DN15045_c0_g1_i2.p1  ORF type:complete len:322 (+),score=19.86 TRINITY_DN15045_c0_g1_i2:200-1165(+)
MLTSYAESTTYAEPVDMIDALLKVLHDGYHKQKEEILNGILEQKGTAAAWVGSGIGDVICSVLVEGRDARGDMIPLSLCKLFSQAILYTLRPVDRAIRTFFQTVLSVFRSPKFSLTPLLCTITHLLSSDPVALRIFLTCNPGPVLLHLYRTKLALPRVVSVDVQNTTAESPASRRKSRGRVKLPPDDQRESEPVTEGPNDGDRQNQQQQLNQQNTTQQGILDKKNTRHILGAGGLEIVVPMLKLPKLAEITPRGGQQCLGQPRPWKLVTKSGDNRPQLSSCRLSSTDLNTHPTKIRKPSDRPSRLPCLHTRQQKSFCFHSN